LTTIAILGCGPAGLFAAEAVAQAGYSPTIFSIKRKSEIPGSQYLHERIPGLTTQYPDNVVQYVRMGTPGGYAKKVYGNAMQRTGWESYSTLYPSWNVVNAYERAWERYQDSIINVKVEKTVLRRIVDTSDLVISTLPAQTICENENHSFTGTPFWIKTLDLPYLDRNKDIVIYNGLESDHWYRWSILSGICSIESTVPPDDWMDDPLFVLKGTKAGETDCDCWKEVVRAGRWAEWRHGVLLHDAFRTTELELVRRFG